MCAAHRIQVVRYYFFHGLYAGVSPDYCGEAPFFAFKKKKSYPLQPFCDIAASNAQKDEQNNVKQQKKKIK